MILSRRKLVKNVFFAVALYSLFTYVFAHLAYLNMNTETGLIFEYVSLYFGKITSFIVPTAISVLTLALYLTEGRRSAILITLFLSSARIFHTLPYYYIIFIYNYGYDSIEALTLSLISSVGIILATSLGAFITFSISLLIIRRRAKKSETSIDPLEYLNDSLLRGQPLFDFTDGANMALLIIALYRFVCALIPETIDTVAFFIEYKLDYTVTEILTITANYLLIFAMIFVSYLLGVKIKNLLFKSPNSK